jgi:oxygen-dependent protoporphyrinogen oxidase
MIAIIGGGMSGLAAAYELSLQRLPFVLFEASNRLGGLVRTEHIAGCTIDAGADSILTSKPAALRLCEELGLAPRLMSTTPPRIAFVHAHGELHALPSPSVFGIPLTRAGMEGFTLLSPEGRAHLVRMSEASGPGPRPDDESVAAFYRREFGPETVATIAQPLLGGIHAGDVEQLSMAAVAPRLRAAAEAGTLFRAPETSAASGDGVFKALRGGMSELVAAIAARLPVNALRLGAAVRECTRTASGWQLTVGEDSISAQSVIVAAPSHAAGTMLAGVDGALASLCAQVPYVSTVSVALAWPRSRVVHRLAGSGFVVARQQSGLRISACTWVSSKWQDRAPAGTVLLRAFLGGATDPAAAELPDDDVAAIATGDVSRVLGASGAPELIRIQRWPRAGAQHNVGHRARLEQIGTRLRALPGLFVAGSGFRAIGIPDCVADGRAAAIDAASFLKLRSREC